MLLPLPDVAKYSSLWKDSFVMKHKSYDQSRGKASPNTVMKTDMNGQDDPLTLVWRMKNEMSLFLYWRKHLHPKMKIC